MVFWISYRDSGGSFRPDTVNPLEYLDVYRLPVFGRVENSTSEHLTRKVRGNDLSSRYCTLSSERRLGFGLWLMRVPIEGEKG
ncbi:unnamed protein product [Rhizophagus irregularis]|nr:unnamed protein product [Rhizophagus irregularis]